MILVTVLFEPPVSNLQKVYMQMFGCIENFAGFISHFEATITMPRCFVKLQKKKLVLPAALL